MLKKVAMVGALMGWLGLLVVGTTISATYENKPGDRGFPPTSSLSPTDVVTSHHSKRDFHLLMFVHPKCPCTRASMYELRKLLQKHPDLSATIYFYRPGSEKAGWEKSEIWKIAESVKTATAKIDLDGNKARSYRIVTSGQVLLYDANQHLVFSGGITGARGHIGDNIGEDMIDDVLANQSPVGRKPLSAPVFGCRILKDGTKLCDVSERPTSANE
jgi:hypothetical protein